MRKPIQSKKTFWPGFLHIFPVLFLAFPNFSFAQNPATHLVIEADTSWVMSPNADNPVQTITLGARDTSASVYAILRDLYGNWVDYSKTTIWSSADESTVIVYAGKTDIGQGIISRRAAIGQAWVIAKDTTHAGAGFTDSVMVVLSGVIFCDSLRIAGNNSLSPIGTLLFNLDRDTILQALCRRSDNGTWQPVLVTWAKTGTLQFQIPPPISSSTWDLIPLDTGSGWIKISSMHVPADSIWAMFLADPRTALSGKPGPAPNRLSIIIPGAGKCVFHVPGGVAYKKLSLQIFGLSGRLEYSADDLDITEQTFLDSRLCPGVFCMRLCADGKTILQRRLLIAR
jgi:hypothetical protein